MIFIRCASSANRMSVQLELASALDVHLGVAVDQNVRNRRIGEERLERTQAEHLVLNVTYQACALGIVDDHRFFGEQPLNEDRDLFLQPFRSQALHHRKVDAVQQSLVDPEL